MSRWRYKINIKQHLGEGETKAAMQKSLDGILSELKKLPPGLTEHGHGVIQFKRDAELAIEKEDVRIFNLGMDALYDWADSERIWCGL